jgi:trans-aconitate 2-methyltransferase
VRERFAEHRSGLFAGRTRQQRFLQHALDHFMADTWNPAQYDKFQREREQPFHDLLELIQPRADMRIADLGCGTGKLTRTLHQQLAARETVGIDRSDSMLADAGHAAMPGLQFSAGTIEAFAGETSASTRWDVIFSNAALHWVDDHEALISRLAGLLAPSGQLAFQVPAQHDALTHRVADELTTAEPFASAFGGWRRSQPVLAPEAYAHLLYRCGFAAPKVRLIVYPHVLASRDEVVEWVKGTLLTEYKRQLSEDVYDQFVQEYRRRLLARLDDATPYFYPFKRILCWGQRSA